MKNKTKQPTFFLSYRLSEFKNKIMQDKIGVGWISFWDAVEMRIGYRYKGEIELDFSVAKTIKQICEDAGNYGYKKVKVKLKNPILRPFRKDGNVLEFGIHDRQDKNGMESVCGFFRLPESKLNNHDMFERVEFKSLDLQEHELMLMEAMVKADRMSLDFFIEAFSKK